MAIKTSVLSSLCVLGAVAWPSLVVSAHAQPASARVTWQFSEDHVNWGGSRYLSPGTDRVYVRALLTYQQPATYFTRFGMSHCDPTITSIDGAGMGDTVQNIYWRYNASLLLNFNQAGTTRFGDVLKIDQNGDTAPPGMGTGWLVSFQDSPSLQPLTDDLPVIVLYQYTLILDGTPGVREINGAFRNQSSTVANPFVRIWAPSSGGSWSNYPVTTEVIPALIGVPVPTPATASLLALAGLFAARRRRPRG
jgi:MYXO-CTERM domain-containing protein